MKLTSANAIINADLFVSNESCKRNSERQWCNSNRVNKIGKNNKNKFETRENRVKIDTVESGN